MRLDHRKPKKEEAIDILHKDLKDLKIYEILKKNKEDIDKEIDKLSQKDLNDTLKDILYLLKLLTINVLNEDIE